MNLPAREGMDVILHIIKHGTYTKGKAEFEHEVFEFLQGIGDYEIEYRVDDGALYAFIMFYEPKEAVHF